MGGGESSSWAHVFSLVDMVVAEEDGGGDR